MVAQGSCSLCCGLFWKTAPPLTIAIPAVVLLCSIAFFITCMSMYIQFQCFLMDYTALMPGAIFLQGHVWRIVTPHLVPATLWQTLFILMSFVPPAFILEKKIGSLRFFGLLVFCMAFVSLTISAIAAVLYYTPGINKWSYFKAQWFSTSDLGPTSLLLFTMICSIRALRQRTLPFCFCQIPSWAYILITYVFAQLMMYPPWYGIFYNLMAVIAGLIVPRSWLQGAEDVTSIYDIYTGAAQQAESKDVELRPQGQQDISNAMNSIRQEQTIPAPDKSEAFTARGRIL
ncbi:hypothetical protein GL50803_0014690 [Giardia duodenalis]|uniref:Uncharacterized protein n=1 Tax=Giardia intestinalis (strain ATCC 50803 / WB clone C6) TaxID=184922 RepID=A8BRT8_GIAIC|nr:hypothetical protein GL50803_0014690 [Giardia intestinalis]KAE8304466.1 hypothetical protein GL50803_0014690 [Giardia intestinalis]|eukprot:XP_001705195.1 Hypothetical protein GL50803_14690 [Giardia lamblia ATCC 50803]